MRIPGLGAEVLNRLGAIAVNLPGGEVLPSLQTGAIDATEWAGPYNDLAMGFYKVAPYYYGPGIHEPGPSLSLTVNREAWDALPGDLQAILRYAAGEENMRMYAETMHGNALALEALVDRYGVESAAFPGAGSLRDARTLRRGGRRGGRRGPHIAPHSRQLERLPRPHGGLATLRGVRLSRRAGGAILLISAEALPARVVSNGEFNPPPQSRRQKTA